MNVYEFADQSKTSFTLATTIALLEFTNDNVKNNTAELVGKKILAGVSFLVLPFIAIIEGVVRGIFAIPALFGFLIPEGKCRDWYIEHLFFPLMIGSLVSFATAPGLFALNYFNIEKKHIEKNLKEIFPLVDSIYGTLDNLAPPAPKYSCCKPKNSQFKYNGL